MSFLSFKFLGLFLVVWIVYWLIRHHRLRMAWLLLASAGYYMTWNPWLITLILFSASVDYFAAMRMERLTSLVWKRVLLIGSITINLGLLAYFKYVNFFLDTLGLGSDPSTRLVTELLLPLGISFYTFETISYIVDVYRGRLPAVRNPIDYALFILFFPHLLAGPIVRAGHFMPQVQRPRVFSWNRMALGLRYIALGVFKKAILADHLATVVDPVFANPGAYSSEAAWIAVFAYAVQIFCDFSGYTDIAIGLAHTLDFRLPTNFNHPYLAASPAEFWHRWHISLSSWLRDYLFIPLGGSRGGTLLTCRNLLLVMLLGGLWHGAAWTFVVWGLFHGLLLVVHRATPWPGWLSWPAFRPLCVLTTFLLVCLGWVLFRSPTFAGAWILFERLALPVNGLGLSLDAGRLVLLALVFVFLSGYLDERGLSRRWEKRWPEPVLGGALALSLTLILLFWPENPQPFIYFQF